MLYIGGGQDREQALIAPDLAAQGEAIGEAIAGGAAVLAVCGGYQLLGRFYRGRDGEELPGAGVFPLAHRGRRAAADRRLPARVRARGRSADDARGLREPCGHDVLDEGAEPLGRVVAGYGNDGGSGFEGVPGRDRCRDVPPRAAPAAQPLARRLAAGEGPRACRARSRRARHAGRRAGAGSARRRGRAGQIERRPLLKELSASVHARTWATADHPPLSILLVNVCRVCGASAPEWRQMHPGAPERL